MRKSESFLVFFNHIFDQERIFKYVGGPKGIIPGAFVFTAFFGSGQFFYSKLRRLRQDIIIETEKAPAPASKIPSYNYDKKMSFWDYITSAQWSPIRYISEEQYQEMLETRLRVVEKEIEQYQKALDETPGNKEILV